jgi:hypothetical protein
MDGDNTLHIDWLIRHISIFDSTMQFQFEASGTDSLTSVHWIKKGGGGQLRIFF